MTAPVERAGRANFLAVFRSLIMSSHPVPTAAVTAFAAGLGALAGLWIGSGVLVTAAVFFGQLTIGWSNDAIDFERDRVNDRSDKPIAEGDISRRTVAVAAWAAGILTVAVSIMLAVGPGWQAGIAPVVIAASGLLYNFGAKATVWSWLPYAVAFGSLPAAATLALPAHPWPVWWAMLAGALLGVAAHFANVLPDLIADERTGVRGLPHRLGSAVSAIIGPFLLLSATLVILFGSAERPDRWRILAAVGFAVIACVGARAGVVSPGRRELFIAMIGLAGAAIALFALTGASLVS